MLHAPKLWMCVSVADCSAPLGTVSAQPATISASSNKTAANNPFLNGIPPSCVFSMFYYSIRERECKVAGHILRYKSKNPSRFDPLGFCILYFLRAHTRSISTRTDTLPCPSAVKIR